MWPFNLPKYRIVKLDDIYPWQIQRRVCLFFWRNYHMSYGSKKAAKAEVERLLAMIK